MIYFSLEKVDIYYFGIVVSHQERNKAKIQYKYLNLTDEEMKTKKNITMNIIKWNVGIHRMLLHKFY